MEASGDAPELVERPPGLARTFNEIADDYDARPPYPSEVFRTLAERAGLGPGTRVLEVGPGTGQATIPMIRLGAHVTAVEPGAQLAAQLRKRTSADDVDVVLSTFEDAVLPAASFDIVAAATAYHWVDARQGATKCASVVRDHGWVALWWTIWGDPQRPDPFHDAFLPILEAKAPHLVEDAAGPAAYERDIAARAAYLPETGAFDAPRRFAWQWEGVHDPVAIRRLCGTFAGWIALPEPLRSELLDDIERLAQDEFGGVARRPYQTILYLSQRLAR
jgi:SAM-dependent methyltransferase